MLLFLGNPNLASLAAWMLCWEERTIEILVMYKQFFHHISVELPLMVHSKVQIKFNWSKNSSIKEDLEELNKVNHQFTEERKEPEENIACSGLAFRFICSYILKLQVLISLSWTAWDWNRTHKICQIRWKNKNRWKYEFCQSLKTANLNAN